MCGNQDMIYRLLCLSMHDHADKDNKHLSLIDYLNTRFNDIMCLCHVKYDSHRYKYSVWKSKYDI